MEKDYFTICLFLVEFSEFHLEWKAGNCSKKINLLSRP